jgi:calnexin
VARCSGLLALSGYAVCSYHVNIQDGEWEAPTIPNPACEDVGCGEWAPKKIRNPEYKGKWTAPLIENPAYIGEWAPRQIPNPNYFVDEHPSDMAPIAALAVEVWTTNSGIHFDNFLLGDSLSEAFAFAEETFRVKEAAEKEQDVREAEEQRKRARQDKLQEGGFVNVAQVYLAELLDMVGTQSPIAMVSAIAFILISLFFCLPSGPSAKEQEEAVEEGADDAKEEKRMKKKEEEEEGEESAASVTPKSAVGDEDEDDDASSGKKSSPTKRRTRKTD